MQLLTGMLSKSRGQVLRVAATLHAFFYVETPQQLPADISNEAIVAAVNFVEICNQHVAFLSGMGDIDHLTERNANRWVCISSPRNHNIYTEKISDSHLMCMAL